MALMTSVMLVRGSFFVVWDVVVWNARIEVGLGYVVMLLWLLTVKVCVILMMYKIICICLSHVNKGAMGEFYVYFLLHVFFYYFFFIIVTISRHLNETFEFKMKLLYRIEF